jgi:hypothetical protein
MLVNNFIARGESLEASNINIMLTITKLAKDNSMLRTEADNLSIQFLKLSSQVDILMKSHKELM